MHVFYKTKFDLIVLRYFQYIFEFLCGSRKKIETPTRFSARSHFFPKQNIKINIAYEKIIYCLVSIYNEKNPLYIVF